ncbi:MAG: pyridoxal-dependent decarboxylase [Woeseiaceae bacterium]|nr:pyridoxal-dependent decarboxylase [Woeseiaceae bacterium]
MSRWNKLLDDAAVRGARYLENIGEQRVAPDAEALEQLNHFIEPLSDDGVDDAAVLRMLDELGSPATVAMAGPRYFGFVIGGALPATVACNWLAGAWDQNVGALTMAPAASVVEQVALDWLKDLLGLPETAEAGFVTGATVANFTALAAARNKVYADVGWNVEADGLFGAPPVTVIVGDEVHPSASKALGMLGFGRDRVTRVPVDGQGRMIASELPDIDGPTIVCTQAGNVNTGAFDPIGAICERVRPQGAWVHVDGAFGLWAAASPSLRHLVDGIGNADSWASDAHKWLNVPYDSGLAFVRHAEFLKSAMAVSASYLASGSGNRDPADFTPELSRRGRGIEIWAALKSLGRNGVVELVDRCCAHARRFAAGFEAAGFEILNDVVLNQVLVKFGDEARTRAIIEAIQNDGTCWCGVTVWQGHTAMRISVSNWSTTIADVDRSLEAMIRIAKDH